jgi:hypothetical protein
MAEETLVKENLTAEMIRGGEALTQKLDALGWPVAAAFWYFETEANEWTLMIASPRVTIDGPLGAYEAVQQALTGLEKHFTSLEYIRLLAPEHALVQTMASALQAGARNAGIRVSRTAIDGHYIEDLRLPRQPQLSRGVTQGQ